MSDYNTRTSYNAEVSKTYKDVFAPKFKEIHNEGMCFGDDLAREAFEARSQIKEKYQGETSKIGLFFIGIHNAWKYGSWQNPSYEYFRQFKTPEEIAYSAFKTDGSDLGLENNGFNEILQDWKLAYKINDTLYPENMYPDYSTASFE